MGETGGFMAGEVPIMPGDLGKFSMGKQEEHGGKPSHDTQKFCKNFDGIGEPHDQAQFNQLIFLRESQMFTLRCMDLG